jgi:hypothetical protein
MLDYSDAEQVQGKFGGRLVMCATRNPYQGDLPIYSDDGGETWNVSLGVDVPGMDECQIAQAGNGSLFLIARNCNASSLGTCGMMLEDGHRVHGDSSNVGSKTFAVAWSDTGGETWGPIGHQPQLITPVSRNG